MQITRNNTPTGAGPKEWFAGEVDVDAAAAPSSPPRLSALGVRLTPGPGATWHSHPNGRTVYLTAGAWLMQRRGGPVEVIRPGDRVFFAPREEHWHVAMLTSFMTHPAMRQADDQGTSAAPDASAAEAEHAAVPSITD
jgi:quercetin dioxygenase-like cupin family protein